MNTPKPPDHKVKIWAGYDAWGQPGIFSALGFMPMDSMTQAQRLVSQCKDQMYQFIYRDMRRIDAPLKPRTSQSPDCKEQV